MNEFINNLNIFLQNSKVMNLILKKGPLLTLH